MARTERCAVCDSHDRDLIESLCAAGSYLSDVAHEFGFQERIVRRHEALHSTKQPAVDPLAILRHMRWLQEKADILTRQCVAGRGPGAVVMGKRIEAIDLSLKICKHIADLTGAKKYMDPHVMLPRWGTMLSKLAEILKDNQPALTALVHFIKQNGPPDIPAAVQADRYTKAGVQPNGDHTVEVEAEVEDEGDSLLKDSEP